jgi:DNA-binding NarL/FixJ family response regulator
MITIFVVARIRLYRDGLVHSLGRHEGIRVVGAGVSVDDAALGPDAPAPDVVVVADGGGPAAVERLLAADATARVIAVAVPDTDEEVVAYAEAGAAGIVGLDAPLDELVACVRSAARGELACSPRVAAILLRRVHAVACGEARPGPAAPPLTARQQQILELIGHGLSNKEIALRLCIEVSTVKNHVHQILDKLGVQSRADAAARLRLPARLTALGTLLHASGFIPAI